MKCFLSIDPGLTVLELKAYRHCAHSIVPDVIDILFVEKLLTCGTQEFQFRAAEDVVEDLLSVLDVIVVLPPLYLCVEGHGDLP
jgi:hypothetical protein